MWRFSEIIKSWVSNYKRRNFTVIRNISGLVDVSVAKMSLPQNSGPISLKKVVIKQMVRPVALNLFWFANNEKLVYYIILLTSSFYLILKV